MSNINTTRLTTSRKQEILKNTTIFKIQQVVNNNNSETNQHTKYNKS